MTYADNIFKENIKNILENGVFSENARPKYKDGKIANSKYITGAFATYDLSKGQFPITTLRRIPIKSAIKELSWIYQKQTSSLEVLENELGVTYWHDWDIGDRTQFIPMLKLIDPKTANYSCEPDDSHIKPFEPEPELKVYASKYKDRGYGEYVIINEFEKVNPNASKKNRRRKMVTCKFLETGFEATLRKDSLTRGQHPMDNYVRTLNSIGYLGYYETVEGISPEHLRILKNMWSRMMKRAYDGTRPMYDDVFVDNRWHSFENFLRTVQDIGNFEYAKANDFEDFILDKDYYGKNNYSPDTTVFSTYRQNLQYRSTSVPIKVHNKLFITVTQYAEYANISKSSAVRECNNHPEWQIPSNKLCRYELFNDCNEPWVGLRYGATVKKHDIMNRLLKGLEENPWNRRNIINLWQYEDFDETDGLLPCAFQTMFDVRREADGAIYLDATLTQRSNDMLVAHHINAMQYVALQMMIAKHFSWKVGKFFYFVNNLHIYDNQFKQARELLDRASKQALLETVEDAPSPRLVLNVPDGTNFYDIKPEDFELVDYKPHTPQLQFDLAI